MIRQTAFRGLATMTEKVLLLHGLLMRRPALVPLALRLRARGYEPHLFSYSSLWDQPDAAIAALSARIRALAEDGPIHLVAHSLGGLLAVEALNRDPTLPVGRVACLGSPLVGSAAARGLRERRLGLISGRAGPLLCAGVACAPEGREIGMVAGTRPVGLGRVFGRLDGDNDGTVAVAETRLPGLAAHCTLPVTHTGLAFSAPVAGQVDAFLRHGHFQKPI
jgi:pimeloyl-ACP methyl ester carboxylesterase